MKRATTRGFTIVEMLIYLAISGAMFTVAFFGLRGQQDNVGFRQALNGIEQKIREVFNNVDNGYFGNAGQYTCSLSGGYPQLQDGVGGGDSVACIYIGKAISFSGEQMTITTRIGARLGTNESEPSQLTETYNISNSVIWQKSRICDQDNNCSDDVANLRVSAMRDRNDNIDIQADLRAQRKYNEDGGILWIGVTDVVRPTYCFALGDEKKGSITITQKDIKVDYNGVGC